MCEQTLDAHSTTSFKMYINNTIFSQGTWLNKSVSYSYNLKNKWKLTLVDHRIPILHRCMVLDIKMLYDILAGIWFPTMIKSLIYNLITFTFLPGLNTTNKSSSWAISKNLVRFKNGDNSLPPSPKSNTPLSGSCKFHGT